MVEWVGVGWGGLGWGGVVVVVVVWRGEGGGGFASSMFLAYSTSNSATSCSHACTTFLPLRSVLDLADVSPLWLTGGVTCEYATGPVCTCSRVEVTDHLLQRLES